MDPINYIVSFRDGKEILSPTVFYQRVPKVLHFHDICFCCRRCVSHPVSSIFFEKDLAWLSFDCSIRLHPKQQVISRLDPINVSPSFLCRIFSVNRGRSYTTGTTGQHRSIDHAVGTQDDNCGVDFHLSNKSLSTSSRCIVSSRIIIVIIIFFVIVFIFIIFTNITYYY
jgi:hypothetical protein